MLEISLGSRIVYQGLRLDHYLEGESNFVPWKRRIMIVLEDNGVGEFVNHAITPPPGPQELTCDKEKTF